MRAWIDLAEKLFEATEMPPAFWQWFGTSKVVDARGQPLVLYHGTATPIATFRGIVWGSVSAELAGDYAASRASPKKAPNIVPVYMRIEHPFDADLGLSKSVTIGEFFDTAMEQAVEHGWVVTETNRRMVSSLLSLVRQAARREESGPHYDRHNFWNEAYMWFGQDGAESILRLFELLGFDGIKMMEGGTLTFGALRPQQVKSIFTMF